MQINPVFDATNIPPVQAGGKHPDGTFPFTISNTYGQPTKDNTGGMFVVEFSSAHGSILKRYNLWNTSEKAVEIAQKELSALCHAVGVFQLSFDPNNLALAGRELRGAVGVMEVAPQANNPEYNEVKKVFDKHGNEPGKPPGQAPQVQQPQQPSNPAQNPSAWAGAANPPSTQWGPSTGAPTAPPWGRQ